jgi:hypothetical protein
MHKQYRGIIVVDEKESKALTCWRVEIACEARRVVAVFARLGEPGSAG